MISSVPGFKAQGKDPGGRFHGNRGLLSEGNSGMVRKQLRSYGCTENLGNPGDPLVLTEASWANCPLSTGFVATGTLFSMSPSVLFYGCRSISSPVLLCSYPALHKRLGVDGLHRVLIFSPEAQSRL